MKEAAWSRPASRDLEIIGEYWEQRIGEERAARIVKSILRAAEELVALPSIGHHRQDVNRADLLFWNVNPYILVFERGPDVRIVRVVHSARDLKQIL